MELDKIKARAKELGVPVLVFVQPPPEPTAEEEAKRIEKRDKAIKQIMTFSEEIVTVCGTCGKEISRKALSLKEPCGHTDCPFGILTNKN